MIRERETERKKKTSRAIESILQNHEFKSTSAKNNDCRWWYGGQNMHAYHIHGQRISTGLRANGLRQSRLQYFCRWQRIQSDIVGHSWFVYIENVHCICVWFSNCHQFLQIFRFCSHFHVTGQEDYERLRPLSYPNVSFNIESFSHSNFKEFIVLFRFFFRFNFQTDGLFSVMLFDRKSNVIWQCVV